MKALIIYDDFVSAAKANAALQHSSQNAGFAVERGIIPWPADMLKFPPTAERALADAMDAHLIVFAGQRVQLLLFWLVDWLAHWAKWRNIKDAGLALIRAGGADVLTSSVTSEMSYFAKRHGLNVIFEDNLDIALSLEENPQSSIGGRLHKYDLPAPQILPVTLGIDHKAYRGWQINE